MTTTRSALLPRLTLLALLLSMAAGVVMAISQPLVPVKDGPGDLALYRAIVERVHGGQGYYAAAGAELRARHYGLRSVLNWRTPTLAELAAGFSSWRVAKGILIAFSFLVLVLGFDSTYREGGKVAGAAGTFLLAGAVLGSLVGQTFLFSELWAGTLIMVSVLLLARGWAVAAVVAGVAALFLRELAGLYVVMLLILLWSAPRGSRGALGFLLVGIVAYAIFHAWHVHQVHLQVRADDPAYAGGYLQFGGLRFLLATARQNVWLLLAPAWVTAVYLPVAVYGLFAWPGAAGRVGRPVGLAYLALFAAAGKPFNDYWGLLVAPLLAISFLYGTWALPELVRACRGRG